jgi:hypothetical protein
VNTKPFRDQPSTVTARDSSPHRRVTHHSGHVAVSMDPCSGRRPGSSLAPQARDSVGSYLWPQERDCRARRGKADELWCSAWKCCCGSCSPCAGRGDPKGRVCDGAGESPRVPEAGLADPLQVYPHRVPPGRGVPPVQGGVIPGSARPSGQGKSHKENPTIFKTRSRGRAPSPWSHAKR